MRKFKSTLPLGTGLKFFDKYLETELSAEIWDAMQAIVSEISDLTEGFVLTGGTVTGASPNAQITESIVVLNDKLLRLPATTGQTYPFYIQEATTAEINADYNDLVPRAAIDNEFAELATSAPVSGQYITIAAAGEYKKSVPIRRIAEDNGAVLKTKIIDIGDWNMDTTSSITGIAHGLTDKDAVKTVTVMIRSDAGAAVYTGNYDLQTVGGVASGGFTINNADIDLVRTAASIFDGTDFDDTSYNRGFITIQYVE